MFLNEKTLNVLCIIPKKNKRSNDFSKPEKEL